MSDEKDAVQGFAELVGEAILEQSPGERVEHLLAEDLQREGTVVRLEHVEDRPDVVRVLVNGIRVGEISRREALKIMGEA